MMVEMMRSCYNTQCRFFPGDPTQLTIEWHFCQPGAPYIGISTVFNSLNWVDRLERIDYGEIGEVPGALRTYTKGSRLAVPINGTYCGTPAEFLGGSVPASPPLLVGPNGVPQCCGLFDSFVVFPAFRTYPGVVFTDTFG